MLRKFGIIFIKLASVLLAIKILILLLAKYFVVSSLLIELVSSITDLLIAIGLLILSLTFKFCIYHRLIIYYVFVSYISYIISILFEFSLTNIVFISSFLCLTIIVIFLVVYTYLRYGDKSNDKLLSFKIRTFNFLHTMHYKLIIFENHTKSTSLDITPEQARQILGVTDYTPEQYEILAEITNRPASYFMDDLVDYYVDF